MKLKNLTWALAVGVSAACLPDDPTSQSSKRRGSETVTAGAETVTPPTSDSTEVTTPAKSDDPAAPVETAPDVDEVVELPGIPYELPPLPAGATAPWPGGAVHGALVRVVETTDGDTVKVQTVDGIVTVRLLGINAPECDKRSSDFGKQCDPTDQDFSGEAEYFGVEAWQGLRELIEGKDVRLACKLVNDECEKDLYDRTLAFLVINDDDISETMVSRGFALTYTQFPLGNVFTYCVAEQAAQDARLGIWVDGRDAAITRMNPDTRYWYAYHDSTCDEHAP